MPCCGACRSVNDVAGLLARRTMAPQPDRQCCGLHVLTLSAGESTPSQSVPTLKGRISCAMRPTQQMPRQPTMRHTEFGLPSSHVRHVSAMEIVPRTRPMCCLKVYHQ